MNLKAYDRAEKPIEWQRKKSKEKEYKQKQYQETILGEELANCVQRARQKIKQNMGAVERRNGQEIKNRENEVEIHNVHKKRN